MPFGVPVAFMQGLRWSTTSASTDQPRRRTARLPGRCGGSAQDCAGRPNNTGPRGSAGRRGEGAKPFQADATAYVHRHVRDQPASSEPSGRGTISRLYANARSPEQPFPPSERFHSSWRNGGPHETGDRVGDVITCARSAGERPPVHDAPTRTVTISCSSGRRDLTGPWPRTGCHGSRISGCCSRPGASCRPASRLTVQRMRTVTSGSGTSDRLSWSPVMVRSVCESPSALDGARVVPRACTSRYQPPRL